MEPAAGTGARLARPEAGMGLMVTIFVVVCAVIGWLRSRGRGGGSWWRLLRAMGWGLALLAVVWIAMAPSRRHLPTLGPPPLSSAVLRPASGPGPPPPRL